EVRETFAQIPVNQSFDRVLTRTVIQFNAQLNHIARSFVPHNCLPVLLDAFDAAQEFFEYPWTNVSHAADNHLTAAAAYFADPSRKHSAVTGFVEQSRHVRRTIADERHHVAGQRGVDNLAVAILIQISKLEEE